MRYRIAFDCMHGTVVFYKIEKQYRFLGFTWWTTLFTCMPLKEAELYIENLKNPIHWEGEV